MRGDARPPPVGNPFREATIIARTIALRSSAVLWVVWGLVHAFAGVMTISQDTPEDLQSIADAVDPEALAGDYHPAAGAIVDQHGWNLLWFGVVTAVGAAWVWRGNRTGILVTAMVGGLADLGYFLFLDLGGHVHFVPGTVMTIVSSAAILLSLWATFFTTAGEPNA